MKTYTKNFISVPSVREKEQNELCTKLSSLFLLNFEPHDSKKFLSIMAEYSNDNVLVIKIIVK